MQVVSSIVFRVLFVSFSYSGTYLDNSFLFVTSSFLSAEISLLYLMTSRKKRKAMCNKVPEYENKTKRMRNTMLETTVHCKFNCITVNHYGAQYGIYVTDGSSSVPNSVLHL